MLELLRSVFARRCPAVAWLGPDDYPRCDRGRGHGGTHIADRGMDEIRWTEQLD